MVSKDTHGLFPPELQYALSEFAFTGALGITIYTANYANYTASLRNRRNALTSGQQSVHVEVFSLFGRLVNVTELLVSQDNRARRRID